MLILSFSHFENDARVLKQLRLFSEDYEVITCGYGGTPEGIREHYQVPDEAGYWLYPRVPIMLRQYSRAYWGNPAVSAALELLRGVDFDIVLANDIDSVGLALRLRPRLGVHADLHEYSPRQKEELRRWRWFFAPFVRWMCKKFVTRADSVTTVGEGIAREYRDRFGIAAETVTNASPYQDLEPTEVGSEIRLVHSGIAARERQLEILIEAATSTTAPVGLDLFLMPVDRAYLAELEALAAASGGRVRVRPPVPNAELVRTLNGYDVGLHVLPPTSFNNAWALPNKFFDYVQARLGLIIGPSPEMQRILEREGFGAVSADFGVAGLTAELERLTPELVRSWKRASTGAARRLSADVQVQGWKRPIDALAARDGGGA
nr:glycosyltransferase [Leucobacter edaphi]